MVAEVEAKKLKGPQKEFENLLNEDFKDRKLKENEIIKATVTEITKNFIVVDCKAKMEGMIPVEEFKDEMKNIKVGSEVEVYLERIESFKGEILYSIHTTTLTLWSSSSISTSSDKYLISLEKSNPVLFSIGYSV